MSTSPLVFRFCMSKDFYQPICPPFLHARGCLPAHLSSVSACQRLSTSPFVCNFCIMLDVFRSISLPFLHLRMFTSPFVYHFCITEDSSQRMSTSPSSPPLLHHRGCLPVHLSTTSVSPKMSTTPFDYHICITQNI